jgi:uncharacterized LabA/DUF88 family protein
MKRISVFIDGSNFFYMQKDALNWWVDPKRLLAWIGERGEVVDATYYASVDPDHEAQASYLKALHHMGYAVESKILKTIRQGDGTERKKANLDIEIVLDMFNTIDRYDEAVLVSGDSDFTRALQILRFRGKQFTVLSTSGFVSREIRQVCGMHYKDFQDIREEVEKGQKAA